jgi:hypothetical protein
MREIRLYGSEGGGAAEELRLSLPLSFRCFATETSLALAAP